MSKSKSEFVVIEWAAGGLITVLALCLSIVRIRHAGPLWRDEIGALNLATLRNWHEILKYFTHEAFPLLFPAIIRAYVSVWGASPIALRIFGAGVGTLCLGIIWLNARFLWIFDQFRSALGNPVMGLLWIWMILFTVSVIGVVWLFRQRALENLPDQVVAGFALSTCVLVPVCYCIFLRILRYPTQEWYYIAPIAVLATAIDLIIGFLIRRWKLFSARKTNRFELIQDAFQLSKRYLYINWSFLLSRPVSSIRDSPNISQCFA